jgi:CsoR family transcriptional regulator, copper-sensing transcriptional repressor
MPTGPTTTANRSNSAATTPDGDAPVAGGGVAPGYSDDKDQVRKRLRRIEGQVRGIQRMVEDDRYCIDILGQVAAATSALQSVALLLLDDHLAHCVSSAVRAGGDEAEAKLAEASAAIARLVRS